MLRDFLGVCYYAGEMKMADIKYVNYFDKYVG